ncbi:MAG: TonB-dependent receptor, partial [Anaerophaga sp.]|nr:TonB-dependent receptor [Anaerophaga sp.]
FMAGLGLMAQLTVTGVVTDSSNEPIPGVSVLEKGTMNGTITQVDGSYSLQVPEDATLVFSFIGFETEEVPVEGRTRINVILSESVTGLEEVVVVGYGVQKKKLITGATLQVNGEELQKRNTTSALQALQGQTAGVQITSTSGQPGEDMKVVIRGLGTIGNAGPLYIVDGVQTGDISYLNNSDIESIDVLKDAAAAAIYGSQAANGVVLITTKSGEKGKTQITFDSYYGVQNVARKVDMLNAREYAVIMNEAAINSGKLPYFTTDEINNIGETRWANTDWMEEMFYDNAVTQNYTLGATGGNDVSTYSTSLSYTGQEGIVGGPDVSNYNRYSFRINSEHKFFDDIITIGQHLTFAYIEKNGIDVGNQYNNSLRGAFNTSPFLPVYNDDGEYLNNTKGAGDIYKGEEWVPWYEGESNPYAGMVLNNQSDDNNQKLLGDIYLRVTPIEGLTYETKFGVDFYSSESRSFVPEYELSMYAFNDHDKVSQGLDKGLALTWTNTLTYDFSFGDHDFTVLGGMESYRNKGTWMYSSNTDLLPTGLEYAYIDNALNTDLARLSLEGGPFDESMLLSYFGRLSYNFNEKYMLNATFRADGSSRFAEDNRWGYFPSVSGGWVLTNEPFMSFTEGFMDFFKLRASWGQVGNQNIDPWQYLAPVQVANTNYYFGTADFDAAGNTPGAYPNRLANEDLQWETSEQFNIGFDARFLRSRLGVNFDLYRKDTKDWLLQAPILATAGAEGPFINGGDVRNKGVEVALSWNDQIGDFRYFVSANYSYNDNEVTQVPTNDGIVHGLTNMLYDNSLEFYHRAETGYPIGYFWGWETDGIFQNEQEVLNYTNNGKVIQPKNQPGDLRYIDQNRDGTIDNQDKVMVGDPNPNAVFGFNVGFEYRNFDFTVAANGVYGNQIVQSYRNHVNGFANYTTEILERWHGEGTSNTIPRVTETNVNYLFSDIFVKDGDFLRISDITLGYDFADLINQDFISQLRLYGSVQNAFTFTEYNGMDPEVGYGVEDGSSGIDLGYYPRPRTILVGVNVKF